MAYLKNIYIKTDKVKIWQMGFEFSAHLSCFTEETKLIWKLEDDISTTRKNKTKLTAKKTQKYFFPLTICYGSLSKFLKEGIFPYTTTHNTSTITEDYRTTLILL